MMDKRSKHVAVAVLAAAGTLLAVAAIAVTQGYIPSSLFLGVTAAEIGTLSAVAYVSAFLIWILA